MSETDRNFDAESRLGRASLSRRAILQGGSLGALSLGWGRGVLRSSEPEREPGAVILLAMVGGASPWETLDPKPDAPSHIRGPFGSIASSVPGVRVSEYLPGVARRMNRLSLIRSIHHEAYPTHDEGLRIITTGRSAPRSPALGARVAHQLGATGGMPPFVVLPDRVGRVGGLSCPDDALGSLGPAFEPFVAGRAACTLGSDPNRLLDRAREWVDRAATRGLTTASRTWDRRGDADRRADRRLLRDPAGSCEFAHHCDLARRFVEAGSRFVVVNMATTVFGQPSWDTHGRAPFSTFDDLARNLLPAFDQGFSGLVDDLQTRGQLDSTLVVAVGEFGRTPWINESGGRDHWPGVWSALVAGGGTLGGQVIGASTQDGFPREHPVRIADLMATIEQVLGLPTDLDSRTGDPVSPRPVLSLFG